MHGRGCGIDLIRRELWNRTGAARTALVQLAEFDFAIASGKLYMEGIQDWPKEKVATAT